MVSTAVFAQDITVKGTVTDAATGETIPGASVQLKGSLTQYAMTDLDGFYSLSVPQNGVLVVSFLGYKTAEIPANGRTTIDIALEVEAEFLEDVVVVGYGTAKKITSVVGSAATVNQKVLSNRPTANAGDALQGQVAGMQIFSSTGEPQSNVSVRIRGVNSINAGTTPLFILDGAPVSSSIFNSLNSNDIESIVVMKDASSTAIYGSRAANGVVYITTKKGKISEKPTVAVRGQYGISTVVSHKMNLMNSDQWFELQKLVDPGFEMTEYQKLSQKLGINTNWKKYFFNDAAPVWSVDASVSGATDKTDYYFSIGTFNQTGTLPYSSLSRFNIRSNINTKITNWLKIGLSLGLTYQNYTTAGFTDSNSGNSWYNPTTASNWMVPWFTPYEIEKNDAGEYFINYNKERKYFRELGMYNTYWLQELQPSHNNTLRLNGSLYEDITPIKGLTLRAQQNLEGYDYRYSYKMNASDPDSPWVNDPEGAKVGEQFSRYYQFTFTNTAEYKFDIAKKNHFAILLGQESIFNKDEGFSASSSGFTDWRLNHVSHGTKPEQPGYSISEVTYNSFFARLSYDYADKYYVDLSWRRDGSSLFGANRRYANFYSAGIMWNIKGEDFLQDAGWINDLRFKASYGTTGNSSISNYLPYGTVATYGGLYDGNKGWGIANPSNADLTWETVETLNIGLTGRLWNFVNLNVEFYNKMTRDMLMSIPYSYTTGHGAGWGNAGDMLNRGVDFEIGFDIIQTQDLYFNIKTNFNYNYNEITKLFGGRDEYTVANTGISYQRGYPYGELFFVRSAGVDPRDGMAMWYDLNGNKTKRYSDDYAVMTGLQRYAPWAGGIQLNFQYKGLYVGADFSWVAGKYTINNDKYFLINPKFTNQANGSADLLNIWQEYGQVTDIPCLESERVFDTSLIENASFLRLKNLQISYTFPKKWMQKTGFLGSARIYAIGRNLLTATPYSGYDPEVDSNLQMGVYPNSRQYTVGVELTF